MAPADHEQRLVALQAWRDLDASGDAGRLNDDDLKWIAFGNAITPQEIAAIRGVSNLALVKQLSDEISGVLAALAEGERRPATPAGAPSAVPPEAQTPTSRLDGPFSEPDPAVVQVPIHVIEQIPVPDGLRLRWTVYDGPEPFVMYRLVAGDNGYAPPQPSRGRAVVSRGETHATEESERVDNAPFSDAIRHYGVWVHCGEDLEDAAQCAPRLWAATRVVAPLQDVSIVERDGDVIGNWISAPGTKYVEVMRTSPQAAVVYSRNNLLPEDGDPQLDGFVDRTAEPGRQYDYAAFAFAELDGRLQVSAPVRARVRIPVVPVAVRDIRARNEENDLFTVEWRQPKIGRVEIYRTPRSPAPDLQMTVLERSALSSTELNPDNLVLRSAKPDGDWMTIRGLRWPRDWNRLYVTPVTVTGDQVAVGPTVALQNLGKVTDVELRERVDSQVIVFGWPSGVASVLAYLTPPGEDVDVSRPSQHQVTKDDYERDGGMRLRLPGVPIDIHLVPVAYFGGERQIGDPVRVRYPGLIRIQYRLERPTPPPPKRRVFGKKEPVPVGPPVVQVRSEQEITVPIQFVMVRNATRFPLFDRDGDNVARGSAPGLRAGEWTTLFVLDRPQSPGAQFRLFAEASINRPLALIDPPLATLR